VWCVVCGVWCAMCVRRCGCSDVRAVRSGCGSAERRAGARDLCFYAALECDIMCCVLACEVVVRPRHDVHGSLCRVGLVASRVRPINVTLVRWDVRGLLCRARTVSIMMRRQCAF
jgi:hypothetical protein